MHRLYAVFTVLLLSILPNVEAALIVRDGWVHEVSERATVTAEAHFERALEAFERCDWPQAARQFRIIVENFPKNAVVPRCYCYLGACLYRLGEHDLANGYLDLYFLESTHPELLGGALRLKLDIAEALRLGARRRPYCSRRFPKFLQGYDLAAAIYEEIIASAPGQEIAAKALFSKGCLLAQQYDYHRSIEAFLGLIRRFPKHEMAPDAYLAVIGVYQSQARYEANNPDILELAELTYAHFCADYPSDDRLAEAAEVVMAIRERSAAGLYETGKFYERACRPESSVLYYISAIERFPDTQVAECARCRLCYLKQKHCSLTIPEGLL